MAGRARMTYERLTEERLTPKMARVLSGPLRRNNGEAHRVFTLPLITPSLNQYLRWHWSRRAKFRDTCCICIRMQMHMYASDWVLKTPRRVVITRYGTRKLDYDNFVGGCKPLLDALHYERIVNDDTSEWVDVIYVQGTDKARRGMVVIDVR